MCVIFVATAQRPREAMIRAGYDHNDHGGGMAWREGEYVRWIKGLEVDEMVRMAAELPLPYVQHFRIASCGGKCKELTHPFLIQPGSPLSVEGKSKGDLLFHNGHWQDWETHLVRYYISLGNKLKIPDGPWSDSRAVACIASGVGHNVLDFIPRSLFAVIGPKELRIFGNGWKLMDKVHISNDYFDTKLRKYEGWRQTNHDPQRALPSHYQGPSRAPMGNSTTGATHITGPTEQSEKKGGTASSSERTTGGSCAVVPFAGLSKKALKRLRTKYQLKGDAEMVDLIQKRIWGDRVPPQVH